jgi:pantoate--beta-alanine ligase
MTELLHTTRELRYAQRSHGPRAVVMTMGALHEGHVALIRAARERVGQDGHIVVSVFVNPLQFGPNDDLDRYPRTLDTDVKIAEREGADVVFAPSVDEVYPGSGASQPATAETNTAEKPQVRIAAGPMGERYEGAFRPGHFDGMLTVVAKLLHLTRADIAFFGQKDAQQLALIRRMVADLNFDTEIVGVPTVRESDGLALSSRNRYLTPAERADALALSRALFAGRDALADGPDVVRQAARAVLDVSHGVAVDYLALVDPADFTEAAPDHTGPAILVVAARVGTTRLIDCIDVDFPLSLGAPR